VRKPGVFDQQVSEQSQRNRDPNRELPLQNIKHNNMYSKLQRNSICQTSQFKRTCTYSKSNHTVPDYNIFTLSEIAHTTEMFIPYIFYTCNELVFVKNLQSKSTSLFY